MNRFGFTKPRHRDPIELHPDPDISAGRVTQKFIEPELFKETEEESQARAKDNYGILLRKTGVNKDTPYMLRGLYRRSILLEAAYNRVMERLAGEIHAHDIKKLTSAAQDLHKDYMNTLGAIYKLENDPDPPLVQADYAVIDNPRPKSAMKVLGTRQVVELEAYSEETVEREVTR